MWYEILTPGALVVALIGLPQFAAYYGCKAVYGNPYQRERSRMWERIMYLRDIEIDGAPWKCRGLENIPDEDHPN